MYALNPPNQTSTHAPEGGLMVYRSNVSKAIAIGAARPFLKNSN
jgi:hypothetical protein